MKLRNILIAVIAFSIIIYITISSFSVRETSEYAIEKHQEYVDMFKSSDDADWETVDDNIEIENDSIVLNIDVTTTRFSVYEKATGETYWSYPEGDFVGLSAEDRVRIQSNINLIYYDENSRSKFMGSGVDSVQKGTFDIKKSGDIVRIYYTFGSAQLNTFVPVVFEKSFFENDILPELISNSARRRINLMYSLYSSDKQDAGYNEMVERFPALKERDLYILKSNISQNALNEISGHISDIGYTKELYEETLIDLDIVSDQVDKDAGFVVPLELSLNKDGFTARVLMDKVEETSSSYTLQNITLLEYFGSNGLDNEGYFLIPDGSGAIININQPVSQSFTHKVYANDQAIKLPTQQQLTRNTPLPVFGFNSNNSGYFAIIEGAQGASSIIARTSGAANPQNNIFAAFDVKGMDKSNIGEDRDIGVINLYANHRLYEHPAVRYSFMENNSSYVDMATYYRDYLIEKGVLVERIETGHDIPLYLDFLCMVEKKSNILGITYDKKIVLSRISDIIKVVEELHLEGINNINIRLKNYGRGGVTHGVYDNFNIDRKVGSLEEIYLLSDLLTSTGGKLFFDNDFTFMYSNKLFSGYTHRDNTARRLDRTLVANTDYDLVTLRYIKNSSRYIVSPASYKSLAERYLYNFNRAVTNKDIGLSWSTAGQFLTSDFNRSIDFDLSMATIETAESLSIIKNDNVRLMTDYGNYYVLPYATDIINMPATSSSYTGQTASIPFYQMVVHGYKNYSLYPVNLGTTGGNYLLEGLSTASNLYAFWITAQDKLLLNTGFTSKYYSLNYNNSLNMLVDNYLEQNEVLKDLQNRAIIDFIYLDNQVSLTEFEGGVRVITNKSEKEFQFEGEIVEPNSYKVLYTEVGYE